MAKKQVTVTKKRKKIWLPLQASKVMNNIPLGETYVYGKDDLVGKSMKINLSSIKNDMRKQNVDVYFTITSFSSNTGIATITGLSLTNSFIKRLVRRGRDKIDDSFIAMSKDKKALRIKPLVITNNRTAASINSRIRIEARKLISDYAKKKGFEDFLNDIVLMKIQKELKNTLSKVYPIKTFEIRMALMLGDKKDLDKQIEQEAAEKTEEPEEKQEEKPIKATKKKTTKKAAKEEPSEESEEQDKEE